MLISFFLLLSSALHCATVWGRRFSQVSPRRESWLPA